MSIPRRHRQRRRCQRHCRRRRRHRRRRRRRRPSDIDAVHRRVDGTMQIFDK